MDRQKAGDAVLFKYTNYKGEVAIRRVRVGNLIFKSTKWHPLQWVLRGWDEDRQQVRDFALKDCDFTTTVLPSEVTTYTGDANES